MPANLENSAVDTGLEMSVFIPIPKKGNAKKYFHDPDKHNGVITHLDTEFLKCKVKLALGSITTNKLVEVMDFQPSDLKS